MASKRMISSEIVESESFNDMSVNARFLYIVLLLNSDSYGFVNSVGPILNSYRLRKQYFNELVKSGYIIYFEKERVAVITHWRVQNKLRFDCEAVPAYPELFSRIFIKESGVYSQVREGSITDLTGYRQAVIKFGKTTVTKYIKNAAVNGEFLSDFCEKVEIFASENPCNYGKSAQKKQTNRREVEVEAEEKRSEENRNEFIEAEAEAEAEKTKNAFADENVERSPAAPAAQRAADGEKDKFACCEGGFFGNEDRYNPGVGESGSFGKSVFNAFVSEDCDEDNFETDISEGCDEDIFETVVSEGHDKNIFGAGVSEGCDEDIFETAVSEGCDDGIFETVVSEGHDKNIFGAGESEGSDEDFEDGGDGADGDYGKLHLMGGFGKGVVMISQKQTDELLNVLSLDEFNYYVARLADFILKNNAHVRNHFATILKWVKEDRGAS